MVKNQRDFYCTHNLGIENTNLYILWKNGGRKSMRVYRGLLVLVILIAIGWGIWYCVSNYNDQPSNIDGTLVYEIKECPYVTTNDIY